MEDDWEAERAARELEARRDRAFQHRIYLLDTVWPNREEASASFGILGTTKTVYIVKISDDQGVKCTCPDFRNRGSYCKHALFVLLRVLKVPFAQLVSNLQNGIIDSLDQVTKECMLHFLLGRAPADNNLQVDDDERSQYDDEMADAMDNFDVDVPERPLPSVSKRRKPQPPAKVEVAQRPVSDDDECAICFEDLKDDMDIVYCRYGCGQNLHQDCLNKWANQKAVVTCVYCRAAWF